MGSKTKLPLVLAITANALLGASAMYWYLFAGISPLSLVAFRIIFSLIILVLVLALSGRLVRLIKTTSPSVILHHAVAAVLVAINWATFIWASINANVFESGLGYLVAPLFTMLFGISLLGERLYKEKAIAIAVLIFTLAVLIFYSGKLEHWVYWVIAISWGGYATLKKTTPLASVDGLFIETIILALLILLALAVGVLDSFYVSYTIIVSAPLIVVSGIVSVVPLLMFAFAARNLDAYSMGALQFVLPTTQLIVSILFYKQFASPLTYACFLVIWLTLGAATFIGHKSRFNGH